VSDAGWLAELVADHLAVVENTADELRRTARRLDLLATLMEAGA
jgi:hypothetical protein